ncbi:hypothetical protein [Piscirickettsia salmonis]|nr:hypothetical protein [Piscirickettsia salmonis]
MLSTPWLAAIAINTLIIIMKSGEPILNLLLLNLHKKSTQPT